MWKGYSVILAFLLWLLIGCGSVCLADPVISSCAVTPSVYVEHDMPSAFAKSNSLARKPESLYGAVGKVVLIEGRVLDVNCVPVSNAVVGIWQLNSKGLDQRAVDDEQYYEIDSRYSPARVVSGYDPNFTDTGTATTDNLGYYSFVTVIPGAKAGRAPHVNFIVTHPEFIDFSTVMFFEDLFVVNKKTGSRVSYENDTVALKYPKVLADMLAAKFVAEVDGIRKYRFDITLPGSHVYKRY